MSDLKVLKSSTKGFGGSGFVHAYKGEIQPLGKRVIVKKMHFGDVKTKGGIILLDDDGKDSGIHPRWGQVHAIGNKQEDVKVGQWILVSHGRWTRTFLLTGKDNIENECRMVDEDDILLISDEEPEANTKQAGYVNMGGAKQMTKLPGND